MRQPRIARPVVAAGLLALAAVACHPMLIGIAAAAGGGGGGGGTDPGPPDMLGASFVGVGAVVPPSGTVRVALDLRGRNDRERSVRFFLDPDGKLETPGTIQLATTPPRATGGGVRGFDLTVPATVEESEFHLLCELDADGLATGRYVSPQRLQVASVQPSRPILWNGSASSTDRLLVRDSALLGNGDMVVAGGWAGDVYQRGALTFTRAEGPTGLYVAVHDGGTGAVKVFGAYSFNAAEIRAHGVTVLADDAIVVTGRFRQNGYFGLDLQGQPVNRVSVPGSLDAFVVCYVVQASELRVRWITHLSGPGDIIGLDADAIGGTADIAVGGTFQGMADFAGIQRAARGAYDAFVARIAAADGAVQWVAQAGGSAATFEAAAGVSATTVTVGQVSSARIAVTGQVGDPAAGGVVFFNADGTEPPNMRGRLTGNGAAADVFTAVYGADGTFAWAVRGGGPGEDRGNRVFLAASGSVYTVGELRGNAPFDSTGLPPVILQSAAQNADQTNGFVVKRDQAGNVRFAALVASEDNSGVTDVTVFDQADAAVGICGFFSSRARLAGAGGAAVGLRGRGLADGFVARLDVQNGAPLDARSVGGESFDTTWSIQSAPGLDHYALTTSISPELFTNEGPVLRLAAGRTETTLLWRISSTQ